MDKLFQEPEDQKNKRPRRRNKITFKNYEIQQDFLFPRKHGRLSTVKPSFNKRSSRSGKELCSFFGI